VARSDDRPQRRSIRLVGFDYCEPAVYFVPLCTYQRICLFGQIAEGEIHLNDAGRIVQQEWLRSAELRKEVVLDRFVTLPNHVHGLIILTHAALLGANELGTPASNMPVGTSVGRPLTRSPKSLGSFVAGFKSAATRRVNDAIGQAGTPIWQRNYWEHIVRDDEALARIRTYIDTNPMRWHLDRENPDYRT